MPKFKVDYSFTGYCTVIVAAESEDEAINAVETGKSYAATISDIDNDSIEVESVKELPPTACQPLFSENKNI